MDALPRWALILVLALMAAGLSFLAALLIVMSQNPGTVSGGLFVYGP